MRLLTLFLITISANVYAQSNEEVGFTYWGYEGRNRSFLSCHYVEGASESILRELDATDINVRCSGGIDFNTYSPVRTTAKFVLPSQEQTVTIKSDYNANCYFDTTFIKEIARESSRIEIVSGSTHCFRPDSRYNITLKIK